MQKTRIQTVVGHVHWYHSVWRSTNSCCLTNFHTPLCDLYVTISCLITFCSKDQDVTIMQNRLAKSFFEIDYMRRRC